MTLSVIHLGHNLPRTLQWRSWRQNKQECHILGNQQKRVSRSTAVRHAYMCGFAACKTEYYMSLDEFLVQISVGFYLVLWTSRQHWTQLAITEILAFLTNLLSVCAGIWLLPLRLVLIQQAWWCPVATSSQTSRLRVCAVLLYVVRFSRTLSFASASAFPNANSMRTHRACALLAN